MKTRNGFVSNSSSSSFVVAFEKVPTTKGELRDMLFDENQTCYPDPYPSQTGQDGYPIDDALKAVWRDMKEAAVDGEYEEVEGCGPMTTEQVRKEFEGGWIDGQPEHDWNNRLDFDKDPTAWHKQFNDEQKEREEFGHQIADKFMAANVGKIFFRFEYSDEDGSFWCAMEHGDLFHKLEHFRISHH